VAKRRIIKCNSAWQNAELLNAAGCSPRGTHSNHRFIKQLNGKRPYLFDFRGGQHDGPSRGTQARLTENELKQKKKHLHLTMERKLKFFTPFHKYIHIMRHYPMITCSPVSRSSNEADPVFSRNVHWKVKTREIYII
jgi:hypothetical protein